MGFNFAIFKEETGGKAQHCVDIVESHHCRVVVCFETKDGNLIVT